MKTIFNLEHEWVPERISAERLLGSIRATWPKAFGEPRPLKAGISRDIRQHVQVGHPREWDVPNHDMHWRRQHEWQVFERTLSLVLRAWTNTPKYLRSVVEGAPMIGLDGEIVDTVSSNWAASARREEQRKGPPQQDEDEDNENKQNENKLVRKLYERLLTGGCT